MWSHCLFALQGIVLLALTATFNSLKPQTCVNDGSELCKPTSTIQYAILYTSIALATIGLGGTRYTMATMGANQFKNPKTQASFFNWYFFIVYAASVVSITVIVYVEDNVSWKLGFGLCVIANILGLVIFLCGTRFYRFDKPQGSPFVGLARVVVASTWKRNLQHSSDESKDYYYGRVTDMVQSTPSKSFRYKHYFTLYWCWIDINFIHPLEFKLEFLRHRRYNSYFSASLYANWIAREASARFVCVYVYILWWLFSQNGLRDLYNT